MALLKNTAQAAMDLFFQDFKSDDEFFTLKDFIKYCGMTVTDLLLQEYRVRRSENRSERKDEVIPFSADWMKNEVIEIKDKEGQLTGFLSGKIMSFPFDRQSSGLQDIIGIDPRDVQLERGNAEECWQYKYLPMTNKIFWSVESEAGKTKVSFFKNGLCSLKKAKVRYVPSPSADMEIPDSIENYVIITTVQNMKAIENGTTIDKTADGNPNKIPQTEINKSSLGA